MRHYVRVAGASPEIDIVPFINNLDTLLRGVLERVFFVKGGDGFVRPPRPEPRVFARNLAGSRELLVKLLPSTAPVTHQQFVDSYRGRKQKAYQKALESLRAGCSDAKEDARVRVFVKYEKTDRTTKADPVPRIISPRKLEYNIRVGRYLKPLEHRLFRSINRLWGHKTVIKGYNAEVAAGILKEKWDMFRDPVAVGLDASRFDQHVSLDALKWEHDIYAQCFHGKHRQRLLQLLKHQEVNHCEGYTPDGAIKYSVEGSRMSGDMNTSLGNCLLMCVMMHSYAKHVGVNCALANNGDDCVVFLEREDLEKFSSEVNSWFLSMGFNMVVEPPVDEFEQLEFCQTRPVFDGDTWIMCRNPVSAIAKDSVMLKNWSGEAFFKGWLDAVGTGGLALTGGLPVFQEFYSAFVRAGKKRDVPEDLLPWSFRQLKEGLTRTYRAVHPEARASFFLAYGITPDEQLQLEAFYHSLAIRSSPGSYRFR